MAGHDHDHHDHGGHGHSHAPSADADRRWLAVALGLILGLHGRRGRRRPRWPTRWRCSPTRRTCSPTPGRSRSRWSPRGSPPARPAARYTYGLGRAEILSAQVNGATLLVLAGIIAWEAVQRLADPPEVEGAIVLAVGLAGAGGQRRRRLGARRAPSAARSTSRAPAQHVLADLYGSIGAALAGLLVLIAGFDVADGIVALLVAALMIRSGVALVGQATRVLLEAAPRGIDVEAVGHALAAHPGIVEVHDLHVWEVTSGFAALSAHVLVPAGEDCHARRAELEDLLAERFGIEHTTLQVDHEAAGAPARHHRRATDQRTRT